MKLVFCTGNTEQGGSALQGRAVLAKSRFRPYSTTRHAQAALPGQPAAVAQPWLAHTTSVAPASSSDGRDAAPSSSSRDMRHAAVGSSRPPTSLWAAAVPLPRPMAETPNSLSYPAVLLPQPTARRPNSIWAAAVPLPRLGAARTVATGMPQPAAPSGAPPRHRLAQASDNTLPAVAQPKTGTLPAQSATAQGPPVAARTGHQSAQPSSTQPAAAVPVTVGSRGQSAAHTGSPVAAESVQRQGSCLQAAVQTDQAGGISSGAVQAHSSRIAPAGPAAIGHTSLTTGPAPVERPGPQPDSIGSYRQAGHRRKPNRAAVPAAQPQPQPAAAVSQELRRGTRNRVPTSKIQGDDLLASMEPPCQAKASEVHTCMFVCSGLPLCQG